MSKQIKRTLVATATCVGLCLMAFIVWAFAHFTFCAETQDEMEDYVRLKTLEFNANMNEQLTLIRQMVKSPSVVEHLANPYDEKIREQAFTDFGAYRDSFLSKSVFWVSDVDHEFYNGMEYSYTINPNNPDDSWYNMTLYETDEYNFNINYNPTLKTTMLWVNAVVRKNGRSVGVVGTGIPLSDFVHSMYNGLSDDITMYLYNDSMEITGATDESLLQGNVAIQSRVPFLDSVDARPKEITAHRTSSTQYVLAPLSLVNWHMVLYNPMGFADFWKNAILPLVLCIVVAVVVVLLLWTITILVNQLTILKDAVEELSSGNADLTKRVSLSSRSLFKIFDELVESLNKFIGKLHGIMGEVKKANESLYATGSSLKTCTENTTESIEQITHIIEGMGGHISQQINSVEETSTTVDEISNNISSFGNIIQTQTQNVSQASAAVVEMIGNIDSVTNSINQLSNSFSSLQEKTHVGVAKQEEVNNRIIQIQEQSKMLQDANKIISSIASQTNLLAMNAAIEAAHAGTAGQGFSVVADEIRKLSENSSAQSKTIGTQLRDIIHSMQEIVGVSEDSRKMLNSISSDIGSTNQLVKEITAAMQEQKVGSQTINESLAELNTNSEEVKSASQEISNSNQAIISEIKSLENAASQMKDGMNEMSTGAEMISKTGRDLSELTARLDGAIGGIGAQLDQFNV